MERLNSPQKHSKYKYFLSVRTSWQPPTYFRAESMLLLRYERNHIALYRVQIYLREQRWVMRTWKPKNRRLDCRPSAVKATLVYNIVSSSCVWWYVMTPRRIRLYTLSLRAKDDDRERESLEAFGISRLHLGFLGTYQSLISAPGTSIIIKQKTICWRE